MTVKSSVFHAFEYDFRTRMQSAMSRGLVGASRQVEEYAKNLGNKKFGNKTDAAIEFRRVAALMHTALLASYDAKVEGRKVVESYRAGQGRLAGALRATLASESMVVGNANGIKYLNVPLLNAEAKHWRRLNYGALPKGSPTRNQRFPVYFDQRILFYAGSEGQARPAFQLPVGMFIDPRTSKRVPYGPSEHSAYSGSSPTVDRFYPGGSASNFVRPYTRGIEGRHFIDAGFEVLAAEFGPALESLFRKWGGEAGASFKPKPTKVLT